MPPLDLTAMQFTPAILDAHLIRHDRNKPVCFCRSIAGLGFYRFKIRGEGLLQIEFSESIYRDQQGKLVIDTIFEPAENPVEHAPRVSDFITTESDPECKNYHLFFGGSEDALTFAGMEDFGDWVSINFEQRVFRDEHGGLTVEETKEGQLVRTEFPVSKFIDPNETRTGAFGAISRQHRAP